MKTLLIDNYDSFTYNLMHYIGEADAEVVVKRNDALSISDIAGGGYEAVVISPGPGTPDDSGICIEVVKQLSGTLPIFGVCLGHQVIGQVFGGKVVRDKPMHGKVSQITHTGKGVFQNLPSPLDVTRYHSLIVEKNSLPDVLEITSTTDDGVIMGLQHKEHKTYGVQFHPESIASQHGHEMVKNFLELAKA